MNIEVMKQWLEALEIVQSDVKTTPNAYEAQRQAITSLRQSIAEAQKQDFVSWVNLRKAADQIIKDKFLYKRFIDGTPLANDIPGWMAEFAKQYTHPQPKADHFPDATKMIEPKREPDYNICPTCGGMADDPIVPPEHRRREWVGLTDGELNRLYATHHDKFGQPISASQNGWSYERAIETKLKEKNNG